MAGVLALGMRAGHLLAGWKGLRRFWIGVLVIAGCGAGLLQVLGPPAGLKQRHVVMASPPDPTAPPPKSGTDEKRVGAQTPLARPAAKLTQPVDSGSRSTPGPVADPDPALLEAYRDTPAGPEGTTTAPLPVKPNAGLPRIAADGRTPMHEYATGFDPTTRRPRVGLVVAGIGINEADSLNVVGKLPGPVTLAISPYVANVDHLLSLARIAEHEYLLSIPMEPQGYPINDPADGHALMTSLPPIENLTRLYWALSRISGYVGVTNALGPMRGERLSAMDDQFAAVLQEVGSRGLLFIDARPGQPVEHFAWNRSVDIVIDDDPVTEATLDSRLDALAKLAKDKGSALGLVSVPRPVTLERIVAWSNTLANKGLVLAPVSALVHPPAKQE